MPEIDPNATPVSAEDLARDAAVTGTDPDGPALIDAGAPEPAAAARVESDITLLPPG